jgi:hypothetical protein
MSTEGRGKGPVFSLIFPSLAGVGRGAGFAACTPLLRGRCARPPRRLTRSPSPLGRGVGVRSPGERPSAGMTQCQTATCVSLCGTGTRGVSRDTPLDTPAPRLTRRATRGPLRCSQNRGGATTRFAQTCWPFFPRFCCASRRVQRGRWGATRERYHAREALRQP